MVMTFMLEHGLFHFRFEGRGVRHASCVRGRQMPYASFEDPVAQTPVTAQHSTHSAEAFGDMIGAAFDFSPLAQTVEGTFYTSHEWYTESCIFSQTKSQGFAMARRQPHIQNMGHLVLFSRLLSGRSHGVCGDDIIDRAPGVIYVSDQEIPFSALVEAHTIQSLYIPKTLLDFDPEANPNNLAIAPTSPIGRLVHASIDEAYETLGRETGFVPTAMLDQLMAVLKVALGANPQRGDVRTHARDALFRQICRYIEANLSDPRLSTQAILSAFGVSRAGLYRMFEAGGGVRNYIMHRRSVRALLDLSQAPVERGTIRRASERWGFTDQSTFNRVIQRIYRASPGRMFNRDRAHVPVVIRRDTLFSQHAAKTASLA